MRYTKIIVMAKISRPALKRTERQEQTIQNLSAALGITVNIPETRSECSLLIYDLIELTNLRKQGF